MLALGIASSGTPRSPPHTGAAAPRSRPWPSPATGRLADPTDMPFDEVHLDDPEALAIAIEDLLAKRPHLASRRPTGDIGQGPSQPQLPSISLPTTAESTMTRGSLIH